LGLLLKDEPSTESDSNSEEEIISHIDIFNSYIPNFKSLIANQHDIAAKVGSDTFSSDKVSFYLLS
jgi:ABC-type glutathione transport system ATPase component